MIKKDIDEEGNPLLPGQSNDKKQYNLQAKVAGYLKYYVGRLKIDLRQNESEVVRLAVERLVEIHYGSSRRKTNVIQKTIAVIRRLLKRDRSIPQKTTKSHGN